VLVNLLLGLVVFLVGAGCGALCALAWVSLSAGRYDEEQHEELHDG
jgi:hypothetical protein